MASTYLSRFRGALKSPPVETGKTSRRARKRIVRNAQLGATVAEVEVEAMPPSLVTSSERGPGVDQGHQFEVPELPARDCGVQTFDPHRRVLLTEGKQETSFGALLRSAFGQKAYFLKVTGIEDDERAEAVEHFTAPKHAFEDLHVLPRIMQFGLAAHRYAEALQAMASDHWSRGAACLAGSLIGLHCQSLNEGFHAHVGMVAEHALWVCERVGDECLSEARVLLAAGHQSSTLVACSLGISYRERRLWGSRLQYPLFLGEGVSIAYGCDALPGMTGKLAVPKSYTGPIRMAGVESGSRCTVVTGKQPGEGARSAHRLAGSTVAWQSRFVVSRSAIRNIRAGDVVYSLVGARRADGYWQTDDIDLSRVGGLSAHGVVVHFRLLAVRRLPGGGFMQYARVEVEPWRTNFVYRAVSDLCDCGRVDPQLLMIQNPSEPRGAFAALGDPAEESTIRAAWSLAEHGLDSGLASVYNQHRVLAIGRKTPLTEVHPLDIRARLEAAHHAMGAQPGPGAVC